MKSRLIRRHFQGVKGARVVKTDAMAATIETMEDLWETNGLGAVIGEPGAGKTFSLATGVKQLKHINYVYMPFPPETTARLVSQKLVEALTGESATKIERNEVLRLKARDLLLEKKSMVVCDEAQNLDRYGIENLRYLHDICDCSFPILLCGGDGCWEVLSAEKMLESRIHEYVAHRLLEIEDVLEIIPSYHPMWSDAEPDLIKFVDRARCKGEFRRWAGFTAKAERRLEEDGRNSIDLKVVQDLLATFPPE